MPRSSIMVVHPRSLKVVDQHFDYFITDGVLNIVLLVPTDFGFWNYPIFRNTIFKEIMKRDFPCVGIYSIQLFVSIAEHSTLTSRQYEIREYDYHSLKFWSHWIYPKYDIVEVDSKGIEDAVCMLKEFAPFGTLANSQLVEELDLSQS